MFATLLGPLPRPALPDDAAPEAVLDAVLAAQVDAGLDPLTDGGWPLDADPVEAWRATAARTDLLVKAVLTGPLSNGSAGGPERRILEALAEAGCRWVEIHEPALPTIGADPDACARFAALHQRLTADLPGLHLSLAITGGSVDAVGIEALLAGAYASLALDLVGGPDNWRLAVAAPGDRGIVVGVVSPAAGTDAPEILLWAAGYAASTGGRGVDRVGLATAGSLATLSWAAAIEKLRRLGEGARLAIAPRDEQLAAVDPRAIDARSAALGRYEPRRPRRR
jgi:hypothetical protein